MATPTIHPALREVIEQLRHSSGPRVSRARLEAAAWIAQRLRDAGCEAEVEAAEYHDGYAKPIGTLAAVTALAGLLRSSREAGSPGVCCRAGGRGDRRRRRQHPQALPAQLSRPRPTQNVVAVTGDARADDARRYGPPRRGLHRVIFDARFQAWLAHEFPGIVERLDTSFPLWWIVLAGPGAVALGAALKRRSLIALGTGSPP